MTKRAARRTRADRVRKNIVKGERKVLDFVAFREELAQGFEAVRRSGGVESVFDRPRRV
jgi:hypothetical protein